MNLNLERFNPFTIISSLAIGVVLIVVVSSVIAVVNAGHVGVVSLFGKVDNQELSPGMNLKNPFAGVIKMDVRTQEYTMSSMTQEGAIIGDDAIDARAKDGASVNIDITVLFRLNSDRAAEVYQDIGIDYQEKVIRPAIRSTIRGVIANYSVDEVYSLKRKEVEQDIADELTSDLESRGVIVEDVLLRKVNLSTVLSQSIEEKLAAQQEAQKFEFILQQEEKEAERKRIEAKGQRDAQQTITEGLTNQYLYYLYIQNLKETSGTIYVPINPDSGLPLFKNIE
jgi:regulator of protease activity HflC (stomatin/prohibitin superfamily)